MQKSSLAVIHKHTFILWMSKLTMYMITDLPVCLYVCWNALDQRTLETHPTQSGEHSHMMVRRISLLRFHQSWWFPPFPDLEVSAMLEVATTSPNHGILQYKYYYFIIWSLQLLIAIPQDCLKNTWIHCLLIFFLHRNINGALRL